VSAEVGEGEDAMKASDVNWFRPLWRRVVVTGIVAVWSLWEWLGTRDQLWGIVTIGLLLYCLYAFFYAFPKEDDDGGSGPSSSAQG
jgi:hypothetical protein